ncbi:hypothetical protein [Phycicoccus sp. SLBN-51]|uniref:hypothetical protein n=1 Tax=Phycicoccus sp. SLBN-51 TaxID=2768447 RepID=UPI00114D96E8|nr:hypothetical protein [Phycicoccus sp. SLBN-51]TQJ51545.1 hypothetical protein FBY26_3281 [Phycicoccus sp. SLBN-51]
MSRAVVRRLRWAAAVVAATLALAGLPATASAATASGTAAGARSVTFTDQQVLELTRDGTRRGASGLGVHHTDADRVTARNAAVAYAACDGCRAVALSFQVVLADGRPTDVDAQNLAVAVNDHCRRCETLAVAYQVVVASPGRTHLTEVGRVGLQYVELRLGGLARSGRPLPEIRREADRLMRIVQDIVTEELDARPVIRERERWDRD